jgi:hypothetical protein
MSLILHFPKTKRIIFILSQLVTLFIFSGCVDYGVFYIYIVENKLHQPVKVSFEVLQRSPETNTVDALKSKEIFKDSGLCEKKYIPQKSELPFKKIEICYKDTIKINIDFKNKDLWTFSNKEYEGQYVLIIDTTLLK